MSVSQITRRSAFHSEGAGAAICACQNCQLAAAELIWGGSRQAKQQFDFVITLASGKKDCPSRAK